MSSMRRGSGPPGREKYRVKARSKTPAGDDELRISVMGRIPRYVVEAARLLNEGDKKRVVIKATGNAIPGAITLTEVLKRRFSDLHQQNTVGTSRITETFEPLEVGLDQVTVERDVPFLEVTLTTIIENLDTTSPGYQPPIDQSLVRPLVDQTLSRSDINQGYAQRGGGPHREGLRGGRSDTGYRGRGGPPRGRGGSLYQGSRGGGLRGRGGGSWSSGGYQDENTYGYYRGGRGGRGGMRGRDGYFGGPRGRGSIERQMPKYHVASVKRTDDVA